VRGPQDFSRASPKRRELTNVDVQAWRTSELARWNDASSLPYFVTNRLFVAKAIGLTYRFTSLHRTDGPLSNSK
jgi:hypothetical protein